MEKTNHDPFNTRDIQDSPEQIKDYLIEVNSPLEYSIRYGYCSTLSGLHLSSYTYVVKSKSFLGNISEHC